jgi:hypothetical protein
VLQLGLLAQEGTVPGVTETETTAHPETTTIGVEITIVVSIVIGVIGIVIVMDRVEAMSKSISLDGPPVLTPSQS